VVLAAGLLGLGIVSASGAAGGDPADVPGVATADLTPAGLSSALTTVMVQLPADPITVVDANSPTPLTDAQKDAVRSSLEAAQAPVEQQIGALGGDVVGTYQAAYNGIKVVISQDKVGQLNGISGVSGVWPVRTYSLDNVHGVPMVGGPQAWDGLAGVHGEGIKIADIDTGIDYTHADFGGSGNVADYQAALASDTLPANPAWFGPTAPKVKGGTDLVGDNYNADPNSSTYQPVPHPDPNPLDCGGHGTHTAGTAAGFGVLADGSTYTGSYNASTIAGHSWTVGPGVAPKADIYAVRVFGCSGSTNVVTDAIEWAVDHDMDVINMSLGAPYGGPNDPDAVASTNATKDGVIVVASSGNSGPAPYIDGSPGAASGAISVAATDPTQVFPGATMHLSTGTDLTAIDANGADLPAGTFPVKVIPATAHDVALGSNNPISLGCSVADDQAAGDVTGKFIVVVRGVCARVAKAIFGQQSGAAGVIMINNASGFPPFEGKITNDPDAPGPPLFGGFAYTVTIPFLGVPLSAANTSALNAANGGTVSLVAANVPNPGFAAIASFSSWGPGGDGNLKPNVTAPGVSIASAGMGTGNQAAIMSGTSMAAPHTTGAAALVKQAHPSWRGARYWEAAVENTADPGLDVGYATRANGTGLVQVQNAVKTDVVAISGGADAAGAVSFGFNELASDFSKVATIKLNNFGDTPATFNVSDALPQGKPHTTSFDQSTVTVPARGQTDLHVTLNVPAATAGVGAQPLRPANGFGDVSGLVTLTPVGGSNNGVTLRVPYYMVPQAVSNVSTTPVSSFQLNKTGSAPVTVTNTGGAVTGHADWYSWGIEDAKDAGLGSNDIREVGVQSFPTGANPTLAFAIQTTRRWTNAASDEFDVLVDTNGDGVPNFDVVATDFAGLSSSGTAGEVVTAVFPVGLNSSGHLVTTGPGAIDFFADAPTDSSTIVLPVRFSRLGLTAANPRFSYAAEGFGRDGTVDVTESSGTFNAFTPSLNTGMFDTLAPGGSAVENLTINKSEWSHTPALGWLVVSHENKANQEAQTLAISIK